MLLHRLFDDSLAQAGYLLACEATGDAIAIDPTIDIDRYVRVAEREGVRIRCVTETHIHADFVSGARALARYTGAKLLLSGEGGGDWQYAYAEVDGATLLRHGDHIELGRVRLDVLHTPGHTPEHLSFLATDTAVADQPMGMFTGDFVFVGDVGRPDLLERALKIPGVMESAAAQLHASLQRLNQLPDYLQLWPGHGAGSACGKELGAVPQTTLGYERLFNPALRHADVATFVREILAGQPEPPPYFARMKRVNRDGPPISAERASPPPTLGPVAVEAALASGAFVVDSRPSSEFSEAFLPGTICVPRGRSFLTYFGTIAPEHAPLVVLVGSRGDAEEVIKRLHLIGFDDVLGWALASDVLAARRAAGDDVASLRTIGVAELQRRVGEASPPLLFDVRNAGERHAGQIPGATSASLAVLQDIAEGVPRDTRIVVQCQSGTRAVIGASVLVRRGFLDVAAMSGGFDAWRAAGLPLTTPS
jgi:hydroxyacylglutathione hydrolase